jgi:hypothetical protein
MNLNLPPAVWLVIWLASTAATCILVAWIFYQLGWDHCDREHHPARHATGTPAPASPLPVAGRLDPVDEPEWTFAGLQSAKFEDWTFGGAALEQQSAAAEYLLMVDQASEPCETCLAESDSEFTRRQAREVDELIDRIKAETDHLIDARFAPDE